MNKHLARFTLICTLFLSSCGLGQTLEPIITPSPTSTKHPTQSPMPTITPSPTSTKRPTQSPMPTITQTPLGRSEEDGEKEEIVGCCDIMKVSNVHYESVPGVSRYLHFDLKCNDNWPVIPGECFPGETFIGEPQNILWAEVTCCPDSSNKNLLHCESDYSVEQKVSWTRVELERRGCEWSSPRFYSPPYIGFSSPGCPFNCSPNYCCDCGKGMGCYADCTGCD